MASAESQALYREVCDHARQTALLRGVDALLGWDERCMLPPAAGPYRAEQMTLLSGLLHRRMTDADYGRRLADLATSELAADPHSDTGANIRRLQRIYDKKVRLPQSLVEELTRATVLGQQAWVEARQKNDFPAFRPFLEKIFQLKRDEAAALGYTGSPYDPLLDDYEPEATAAAVQPILAGLRDALVPLVGAIAQSGRRPKIEILSRRFPVDAQESFGREAAARIGFDFQRGRLDVTAHPFCTTLGPHDCRITTRYNANHFNGAFFGILHEAGHGLYEQGLVSQHYGLPLGEAVSLGIHESQSRLWENFVGRSRLFWTHLFPEAQRRFPEALGDVTLDEFYFAINSVQPSLIRVEADEATYNLHILIRFELELAVLRGDLAVGDLPGAWNAAYRKYLGLEPPTAADGVLQDVHWSAGLIGYFPTYSLGNLCAAQFFAQAQRETSELLGGFAQGEFGPLLNWLREKIHRQGQRYSAAELIQRVTGQPLSHEPLIHYLKAKLEPLYGLTS